MIFMWTTLTMRHQRAAMSDRPENSSVAAGLPSTAPIERNSSGSILPKPDDFKALLFYLAGVALLSVMDATIKDVAGRYQYGIARQAMTITGLIIQIKGEWFVKDQNVSFDTVIKKCV